ncbi:hypothetical protein [Parasitella parasitica]|uniref:Uncharacterized protein n=1 Tax=Parasitella parasitica TaxID=35722 RepID=A0A0B7N3I6_9FUNG|nr:hypothetical protein [Parasitella parasitica]
MEPEPTTLMSQLDLQTLVLTMQRDISAHHAALEELNTLKSTILDLKNKNFSLTEENASLRQQIADLTASTTAAKRNPPASVSNQQTQPNKAATSTTTKTGSTYAEVAQQKQPKQKKVKNPADVTDKHRAAITRGFNAQAEGPKGYHSVYINRSRRFTRTEVRHNLHLIGAEASRIIDVTFPARNVIGILIHVQYKDTLLELLAKSKVAFLDQFDPVDPQHVADPKYRELSFSKREDIAFELHIKRCTQSLRYLACRRPHLFASVAAFFQTEGYVTSEDIEALCCARIMWKIIAMDFNWRLKLRKEILSGESSLYFNCDIIVCRAMHQCQVFYLYGLHMSVYIRRFI